MTAVDVLLVLPILVLLFSAYELAGLTLRRWHTISYYASHHAWLKYLITVAFIVAGVVGAIWFPIHASHLVPK